MKKLFNLVAGTVLLIIGVVSEARAVKLGETSVSYFQDIIPNQFELTTSIQSSEFNCTMRCPPFYPWIGDPEIFKGKIFTPLDIGQTFTATKTTDAQFNDYVSLLTNGKTNQLGFYFRVNNAEGVVGGLESFFTNNPRQIDLFGNTIDNITLKINGLVEFFPNLPEGAYPGRRFYRLEATWTVFDQAITSIPEPSYGLGLLGASAFIIVARYLGKN
jgi:hypothetical protein